MDLIQEGNVTLIEGIDRMEPNGGRFNAYIYKCLRGRILKFITTSLPFRIPTTSTYMMQQIESIVQQFTAEHEHEPTEEELVAIMNTDARSYMHRRNLFLKNMKQYLGIHFISLSRKVYKNGSKIVLEDRLKDVNSLPDEVLCEKSSLNYWENAIAILPFEERVILRVRYGFMDGEPRTLGDIAEMLGCSNQTVLNKEKKAFSRLLDRINISEI